MGSSCSFRGGNYTHTSLPSSFIISVKAASLNVTGTVRSLETMCPIKSVIKDQYGCGWTMRFPRCKEIRRDLGVDDCLKYTGEPCFVAVFLATDVFSRSPRVNVRKAQS